MLEQKKVTSTKKGGMKKGYGWAPDLPDHRDTMYGAVRKVPAKLPSAVDLRPMCPPVADQGNSAAAQATLWLVPWNFLKLRDVIILFFSKVVVRNCLTGI
jgi:hypothetical protein